MILPIQTWSLAYFSSLLAKQKKFPSRSRPTILWLVVLWFSIIFIDLVKCQRTSSNFLYFIKHNIFYIGIYVARVGRSSSGCASTRLAKNLTSPSSSLSALGKRSFRVDALMYPCMHLELLLHAGWCILAPGIYSVISAIAWKSSEHTGGAACIMMGRRQRSPAIRVRIHTKPNKTGALRQRTYMCNQQWWPSTRDCSRNRPLICSLTTTLDCCKISSYFSFPNSNWFFPTS